MSVTNEGFGPVRVEGGLLAYKAAVLVSGGRGDVGFRGAGFGGRYGTTDLAQCLHDAQHVPPAPGCSCGFYGWRERRNALPLISERVVAILEVELWGAYHEYERGYVAAAQSVCSVTLRPWCSRCLLGEPEVAESPVVLIENDTATGELIPVCGQHKEDFGPAWTVEALTVALGVPVAWADGDDDLACFHLWRLFETPPVFERQLPGLDDLLPGEAGYVFQNAIAQDADGSLWIDPNARLIRPLLGCDVPIRLDDDGRHEALLDGVRVAKWRHRDDPYRFALPVQPVGEPLPPPHNAEP